MTFRVRRFGSDWHIGDINRRHLTLRWTSSLYMQSWGSRGFQLSYSRMLNPLAWWRAAKCRWNWRCGFVCRKEINHRCWCPVGLLCDGSLIVCGFGVIWFYSRFDGDVPCPCDQVYDEMFGENEGRECEEKS